MFNLAVGLRTLAVLLGLLLFACGGEASSTPTPSPRAGSASQGLSLASPSPSQSPQPSPSAEPDGRTTATVTRVIDGDTVEVAIEGAIATVRYIGVDTPETVAPGRPVDCFGREASAHNRQLVDGATVYMEKDVSETDRFGRLLRYVFLEDGRLVNELLVLDGYAFSSTYPPDVKYQERLLAAQTAAREAGRGLWSACSVLDEGDGSGGTGGDCDAAYPTVCIPPPPPDLDCPDVTFRRFAVQSPDPHRFDADSDGIGCESG